MKKILFLTNDINSNLGGGQELSNSFLLDCIAKDFKIIIINQQFFERKSKFGLNKIDGYLVFTPRK